MRPISGRLIVSLGLVLFVSAWQGALAGGTPSTTSLCVPANSVSSTIVAFVKNFMSATDPRTVSVRDSLGLSNLTAADVTYSTNSTTCQKVSRAIDAAANVSVTGRLVYAIQVGTKAVFGADQAGMTPEGRPLYAFDNRFSIMRVMLSP
jgi:hypothetical protein